MQGTDLATPYGERREKDREAFSEEDHEGNVLWSLRTTTMKLIEANEGNHRGLPTRELFDVANDPGETSNLLDQGHEDITLVESVQRGLQSRGYVPGPLVVDPCGGVNSEHSVMHLQRWMREAVDG